MIGMPEYLILYFMIKIVTNYDMNGKIIYVE